MGANFFWLRDALATVDDELAGIESRFLALMERMERAHAMSEDQCKELRAELAASRRGVPPKQLAQPSTAST